MAITNITQVYPSDLILDEKLGRNSRDVITLNWTAGGTLAFGTVLFRAKSIDPTAPWAPALVTANIAIGNEYAVFLGDRFDVKTEGLVVAAATATPVLALRRSANVKESIPKAIHVVSGFTQTAFDQMKEAFKTQGVIFEDALTAIAP